MAKQKKQVVREKTVGNKTIRKTVTVTVKTNKPKGKQK